MVGLGEIVQTLVLGLGLHILDVSTDTSNGFYQLALENVTRSLQEPVPDSCSPLEDGRFLCEERNVVWGALTFAFIQFPGLLLAVCGTFVICNYWRQHEFPGWKVLLVVFLLYIVPFPLVVVVQLVATLFIQTPRMSLVSAIFLFLEGSLEASPQLLLISSTIMSDKERPVASIQITSMISSTIAIFKTSLALYIAESFAVKSTPSSVVKHSSNLDDGLTKGQKMTTKMITIAKITPAFLSSLVYRVGSLTVICSLLGEFSWIYLLLGLLATFIATYWRSDVADKEVRLAAALFYSLCNLAQFS